MNCLCQGDCLRGRVLSRPAGRCRPCRAGRTTGLNYRRGVAAVTRVVLSDTRHMGAFSDFSVELTTTYGVLTRGISVNRGWPRSRTAVSVESARPIIPRQSSAYVLKRQAAACRLVTCRGGRLRAAPTSLLPGPSPPRGPVRIWRDCSVLPFSGTLPRSRRSRS
jgi:hypothetical protein